MCYCSKPATFANIDTIDMVAKALGDIGVVGVILVAVESLDNVHKLDEKAMNGYGWYRKDNDENST
jgi:tetrahydromethanopterin S-methyltransferase subunit E